MPQISIGDFTGSAQLNIAPDSQLAHNRIQSLKSSATGLLDALQSPVNNSKFKVAALGATFQEPSLPLGKGTLGIKAGVNAKLTLRDSPGGPLFGLDDYDPVKIAAGDYWLSFELDTVLDASAAVPLPDGFGVFFEASTTPQFATYLHISKPIVNITLLEATALLLSAFTIPDSPERIFSLPEGFIATWDIAGAIKIGGSWSLPIEVNQLSLPGAHLPFNRNISVSPAPALKISGDVVISSEFNVRVHRVGASAIRFGIYRKHGSQFEATFTAAAGVTADMRGTDLINAFFKAVDPGIDHKSLSADDLANIGSVLKSSINRSLSLSLSAACSASIVDEAAILYEIDAVVTDAKTIAAIESALHGNWQPLSQLTGARQLRNVIIDTVEKKTTLGINILGLYNYKSVSDFVRELRVVRDLETGSVVITDTVTAKQISTVSNPLAADGDKLAAALYQSFVVTATYQALMAGSFGNGAAAKFNVRQDLLLYRDKMAYREALKQLNIGEALGVLPMAFKSGLPGAGAAVHQARFAAKVIYSDNDVLSFFFSDIDTLSPRSEPSVKRIGRTALAALLDPQDAVDNARIQALQSDQKWAALEGNPTATSASHADWFDVVTWAAAIVNVAPPLADAIRAAKASTVDPSTSVEFLHKRAALAHALEGVTRNTRGAFEKGFPVSVMSALCGSGRREPPPTFEASWDSKTIFSNKAVAATRITSD